MLYGHYNMEIIQYTLIKQIFKDKSSSDSSSDSSSSMTSNSDSDIDLLLIKRKRVKHIKIENFFSRIVPLYSNIDFKTHFRLSRTSVQNHIQDLGEQGSRIGRTPISIKKAVLLTIWIVANQESIRSTADRFGLSKGNAHTIFIRTCKLLTKKIQNYIFWPKGRAALETVEQFNQLRGQASFPNVFGCVDGSHIPIPGPINDNSYYNRKGFCSVLLQGICNAKKEFIDVYCGWPGSTHNARMWQNSPIYQKLNENQEQMLPPNTYLLGDSAYPLQTFIMVPFKDNGHLTHEQNRFNKKLCSTRVTIKQAYGRLKCLFRRLKYLYVIELEYTKYIILTCCILHNISIRDGVDTEVIEEVDDDCFDTNSDFDYNENAPLNALTLRNEIMQSLK